MVGGVHFFLCFFSLFRGVFFISPPFLHRSVAATSLEVLRYEKELIESQMERLADRISRDQRENLTRKTAELQATMDAIGGKIRSGGMPAMRGILKRSKDMFFSKTINS